jgi:predicted amidohydrolase
LSRTADDVYSITVKVAAYQSPLPVTRISDALTLIREQVDICESLGVEILCCAEGVLGGLADYSDCPGDIAIDVDAGQLDDLLQGLASATVSTILGFTELGGDGRLYNAAAVFHRGSVIGVYRKLHPAINRSVYHAGRDTPIFTIGALTFGIVICRDSTFAEPARAMALEGATALFVPTNNGMPASKGGAGLVVDARRGDIARAKENGMSVIRADVAGRARDLVSHGSSGIVDQDGVVLAKARPLETDLIVANIQVHRTTTSTNAN